MIARILAAALAIGVVIFATAVESDTGKLSPERTEAQVVARYGAEGKASCEEKQGYWNYVCRVRQTSRTFTVDVRVDKHHIVDHNLR